MDPSGGILASMAAGVLAKVIVELPGKLRRLIESDDGKKVGFGLTPNLA